MLRAGCAHLLDYCVAAKKAISPQCRRAPSPRVTLPATATAAGNAVGSLARSLLLAVHTDRKRRDMKALCNQRIPVSPGLQWCEAPGERRNADPKSL